MKEEIINGINYRLNEDNLTAEVIQKDEYRGDIIIPDAVVFNEITYHVTSIEELAFEGCSFLTSIVIPTSLTSIGKGAFVGCKTLTSIIVIEGNTIYDSRDNCNAIIEKSTNTLICGCKNTTIPNNVKGIGESAFDCCYSLTSITIPEGVTSIGRRAFADCQWLTTINIPNSVTSIGERAFIWCFALGSITIPDSVKSIEWKAFSGCSLTEITIPSSVTNIGKEAFLDCESLEEIIIGNSVRSIENRAFARCESLFSITYQGTIAQWKEIEFGEDWNEDIPAKVVHCTDGDLEI